MTLAIWNEAKCVAIVNGGITASPTGEFPEQFYCLLDTFIVPDQHYEIFPADGSGKHMHVEGVSCSCESDGIVFTFIQTGYV